ncbi:putative beta-lysine N-acetyltransferase [Oceanobacillus senegalensis]|uniref:putative beta-lysine N-acetyltransferase n=1 Tax=Oceanobacillus senegalensis TaxID=1936063 RepID=UPI000A308534|nr:putative beta-lysine N-acetyltransferase [Oceanobacillus senegalensis]
MQLIRNLSPDLSLCMEQINVEKINQRIKVYQIPAQTYLDIFIHYLIEMGNDQNCDKIIFYVRENEVALMKQQDFNYEGKIKGFFNGNDSFIYALFLNKEENGNKEEEKETIILNKAKDFFNQGEKYSISREYTIRWAKPGDRYNMATLYDTVFESYPTPMNDPDFILEMMNSDVYFSVAEKNGEIVSACSADVMPAFNAAELSDCATIPAHRGKGLLYNQALRLIRLMGEMKIKTFFSYSRSISMGMNIVNAKLGFTYGGKMIRNSNIAGRLENMNIWYKNL